MLDFLKKWWPSLITVSVVLYATLSPNPIGDTKIMWFKGYDKLIHAIMMGGVVAALIFDRRRSGINLTRLFICVSTLSVIVFSGIDEYIQHILTPNRSSDFFDFIANCVGCIIAAFTAPPVVNRIFRSKKTHL